MEPNNGEENMDPKEYLAKALAKIDCSSIVDRDEALENFVLYNSTLRDEERKSFFAILAENFNKLFKHIEPFEESDYLELSETIILEFMELRRAYLQDLKSEDVTRIKAAEDILQNEFINIFKDHSPRRKWELKVYLLGNEFTEILETEFGNAGVLKYLSSPKLANLDFIVKELELEDKNGTISQEMKPIFAKYFLTLGTPEQEPPKPQKPDFSSGLTEEEKKLYKTEAEYKRAKALEFVEAEYEKGKESFLNFLRAFQSIKSFLREKDPANPDIKKFIEYFETKRPNDVSDMNKIIVDKLKLLL